MRQKSSTGTIEKRIQDEQLIADRVGFYAMTRGRLRSRAIH